MSRIASFRAQAGITQAELAKRIKVALVTVQKWENKTRTPRLGRLKTIAKVLGCEARDLL